MNKEEIIYKGKANISFKDKIIKSIILIIINIIFWIVLFSLRSNIKESSFYIFLVILIIIVLISIYSLIGIFINRKMYQNDTYEITNKKVIITGYKNEEHQVSKITHLYTSKNDLYLCFKIIGVNKIDVVKLYGVSDINKVITKLLEINPNINNLNKKKQK